MRYLFALLIILSAFSASADEQVLAQDIEACYDWGPIYRAKFDSQGMTASIYKPGRRDQGNFKIIKSNPALYSRIKGKFLWLVEEGPSRMHIVDDRCKSLALLKEDIDYWLTRP